MTPIKAQMIRLGLTVADLALLTGCGVRTVEAWRAGGWEPPRAVLILLAALEAGKIDIDWLAQRLNGEAA
tara:strand:+ start:736 stop:945 length:210 start_codon:yes stop_codon:yes gene_type:complete